MKKLNKKGFTLADFPKIAFLLITVAVVVGVMATIVANVQSGQTNNNALAANESHTFANNTPIALNQQILGVVPGSEILYNGTTPGPIKLGAGNYTIDYNKATVTFLNVSDTVWASTINITYNYYIGSPARNITGYGLNGTNTFASYIPTVALVSVAALIVGIIMSYLMFKKREE